MNFIEKTFKTYNYRVYLPKDYDENKIYPTYIALHGAGGRDLAFKNMEVEALTKVLEKNDSPLTNAIIITPHCPYDSWYIHFNELIDLFNEIYNRKDVDKTKFNIGGVSMGGYAAYSVMMVIPNLFNKAFICCGAGMYWNAARIKNIKFKIFHGELDGAVLSIEGKKMSENLKASGAEVEFNLYDELGHNVWDVAYNNYDNLKWIIS